MTVCMSTSSLSDVCPKLFAIDDEHEKKKKRLGVKKAQQKLVSERRRAVQRARACEVGSIPEEQEKRLRNLIQRLEGLH